MNFCDTFDSDPVQSSYQPRSRVQLVMPHRQAQESERKTMSSIVSEPSRLKEASRRSGRWLVFSNSSTFLNLPRKGRARENLRTAVRIAFQQALRKEVRYDPNHTISMASGDDFPGLHPFASRAAHYRGSGYDASLAFIRDLAGGSSGIRLHARPNSSFLMRFVFPSRRAEKLAG
jgi:hypothetical protein